MNKLLTSLILFGCSLPYYGTAQQAALHTTTTSSSSSSGSNSRLGNVSSGGNYSHAPSSQGRSYSGSGHMGATAGYRQSAYHINNAVANIPGYNRISNNAGNQTANTAGTFRNNNAINNYNSVGTHYNYANKKSYTYYPSPGVINKYGYKNREELLKRNAPLFLSSLFYTNPYIATMATCQSFYNDVITYSVQETPGNSAIKISFDGFIVYKDDTESGIVTIGDTSVYMERPVDSKHELAYNIPLTDKNLKTVVVYNGEQELHLTRPTPSADLARVIHAGKLNIYDDRFYFPTAENMEPRVMFVVEHGESKPLTPVIVFNVRKPLVKSINKAYGLHLNADDYTVPGLYRYMDQLN